MTSIIDIEGIGPVYKEKLAGAGVKTTEKLLEVAGSKAGRAKLADEISVSEATVLEWVNRADLMRVKGVGEEYSDLLEAAGVDSPAELAHRNAVNLTEAMAAYNAEHKIVRRDPTEKEVQGWIDDAKTLEKVVTH
jgi:predicted flap endonuclease-1-like 5' DNA nuclease